MICAVRPWKTLDRWVPGGGDLPEFLHETVAIEDMVAPRREALNLRDTLGEWTPITIHFDGSVEARVRDTAFKGAMYAAYPGDIVFSKIDIRNGALTVIPAAIKQAVVTGEYPVHTPDPDLVDARYLSLVLRAPEFLAQLKQLASGHSGRKRITAEQFRSLQIPLPDLAVQRRLVADYERGMAEAAEREAAAAKAERDARLAFEAALGLTPPADLPRRFAQIARFRDIERWSHEGILSRPSFGSAKGPREIVQLGDVVDDLENGWSPQCEARSASSDEWGVLKLGAVSFGIFDPSENKTLPKRLKPDPRLEVRAGDVLISRANVLRLVGACAEVKSTRPRLMLCDKIFRVVFRNESPITPGYLAEVMKTGEVRRQIESAATGTSPTMKNISKPALLGLELPLPSLAEQEQLAATLAKTRALASHLNVRAAHLRSTAWRNFVTAVFG